MSNVAGLFIILAAGLAFGIGTVMMELFIRAKEVAKNDNVGYYGNRWSRPRFRHQFSNKWSMNYGLR